jgi:hypothetical protein
MTIRPMRTWWFIRTTGRGITEQTTPGENIPAVDIGWAISGSRSERKRVIDGTPLQGVPPHAVTSFGRRRGGLSGRSSAVRPRWRYRVRRRDSPLLIFRFASAAARVFSCPVHSQGAAMRKPSSLISWTHCGPDGGFSTGCESCGGMKRGRASLFDSVGQGFASASLATPASSYCSPVVGVLLVVQMPDTGHQGTIFSLLRPLNRFSLFLEAAEHAVGVVLDDIALNGCSFRPSLRSRFYINICHLTVQCRRSGLHHDTVARNCGARDLGLPMTRETLEAKATCDCLSVPSHTHAKSQLGASTRCLVRHQRH